MRIVTCGLVVGAALLGGAPVAMATPVAMDGLPAQSLLPAAPASSADRQAAPQAEVSMVAVSLTAGGALAMAGSGMALVLTRRRAVGQASSSVSRAPSQASG